MSEDIIKLAREIFADALEVKDPAERDRYLAQACGQNAGLRQMVESLLRAHEEAGGFMRAPEAVPPEALIGEGPGSVIGRYKLLQQIGEGGFGLVFMAEQLEPVQRKVALKIIKAGMDTREVIARFEAERQALALMDHPNIARVLDAGATATGRPYFVMELVKGIRITDYCDENNLGTEARLKLFIKVCQALEHAHQKGVIHRDLKPGNILITMIDGEPVPKVIDFGVAKAIGQRLTARTLFTRFEEFIGTPAYMSPEQAEFSGVDLDTRSDIYALGVLLYELLTGKTPFDQETLRRAGLDEMRRIIRETEPVRPSTLLHGSKELQREFAERRRADPITFARQLAGDLDWIVMKCLEKDRARRYSTASTLALDVQRHLNHEPVTAGPPGKLYRASKFVRRNRMGVALAASVTLALILGLVAAAVGFIRASRERDRAVAAEQQAEQRRGDAEDQRRRAEATLRRLDVQRVMTQLERGQSASAVATLAFLLRQNPGDRVVAEWLMNSLTLRSFALPAAMPLQHDRGVFLARFSPDGRQILTASRDNCARLWDGETGQRAAEFRHDARALGASDFSGALMPLHAVFSPDGRRVATGSADNTARVWDAVTGQPLTPPLPHSNWVTGVGFSPDGELLATACKDGTAQLWSAMTAAKVGPPLVHEDWVNLVKFSPDGKLLLTASDDTTARLWEVPGGKVVATLQHAQTVKDAAFSPDGGRVVTASTDRTARLWDARSGEPIGQPLVHDEGVTWACFSPDGGRVATASFDKTARIWDGFDGQATAAPMRHLYNVRNVQFSPDGQRVVTCSQDGTARIWDVNTSEPLTEPMRHHAEVWSAEFSDDGRSVVTASSDSTAQVWDVLPGRALGHLFCTDTSPRFGSWSFDGGRVLLTCRSRPAVRDVQTADWADDANPGFNHLRGVLCARFSPDDQRIVIATEEGIAWVWDGWGTRALSRRMRHEGPVRFAEFSGDGYLIVTASDDRTARVWEGQTGKPVGPVFRHADKVMMARFSPELVTVATASADKTARVWDVASGRPVTPPLKHDGPVNCAEYSPDGKWLLTGSADYSVCLWETATGKPVGPRLTHNAPIESARFSPDGRWIVTASKDRTARVWDSRTGQPVSEPMMHMGEVNRAVFSPDGSRVLTASADGTACIWDAQSSIRLSPFLEHGRNVEDAAFSPDGKSVLTCCFDMKSRIWPLVRANGTAPTWLAQLAEAVAGEKLTPQRTTEDVAVTEFFALKQRLLEPQPEDDYVRWARWFLADRATRSISPNSHRTVPEFVSDLQTPRWLRSPAYLERFAEALHLSPTNGLTFAQKAYVMATFQMTNTVRQLPLLDWLTARALALAPEESMTWTARALCLAHAGRTNAALEAMERGQAFAARDPYFWVVWSELLEQVGHEEESYQKIARAGEVERASWPDSWQGDITWKQGRFLWRHGEASARHGAEWKELLGRLGDGIPARASDCPLQLIDLTAHCSGNLGKDWMQSGLWRLDLRALPQARMILGGIEYDVRGIMTSTGPEDPKRGIPVKQTCRRLHFLHATGGTASEGELIATYVVHYADGQQQEIPVSYGRDIRACLLEEEPTDYPQPIVVWSHTTTGGITLQLYGDDWENPRPDVRIETLDFVSKLSRAGPFVLAVTAEP